MKIFISGGLGFVGGHLTHHFLAQGHQVTAAGRRRNPPLPDHPHFTYLSADTTQAGEWQKALPGHEVVINLAGKSIFNRWTRQIKDEILQSRILTTRHLVQALPADAAGVTFCSTSAVGFYGDRGDDVLEEKEPPGNDFLSEVGMRWEEEAQPAENKRARVVLARFGIVLDKNGGAMPMMLLPFRFLAGGTIGSGLQWFPWIHMRDLVAAFQFVIEQAEIKGPLNFCAPNPIRNKEMTAQIAHRMHRPAFLPVPAFGLELALGEFGRSLLNSQRAIPARLEQHGFQFTYPRFEDALREILGPR